LKCRSGEPSTPERTYNNFLGLMDRRPKSIGLTDMFNCVAPSSQTPNLTVRCVGMEPKEGFQPSVRAGVFAEEITLGSDAAGKTVSRNFESWFLHGCPSPCRATSSHGFFMGVLHRIQFLTGRTLRGVAGQVWSTAAIPMSSALFLNRSV